jgi:hypothetical protein
MGLTNIATDQLRKAITSVLFTMWQRKSDSNEKSQSRIGGSFTSLYPDNKEGDEKEMKDRCEYYPLDQLASSYVPGSEQVNSIMDESKEIVSNADAKKGWQNQGKPINIFQEFTRPVTAVFVTNAVTFILKKEGKPAVTIKKKDVNWQGVLKEPLPDYLMVGLRSNVDLINWGH